MASIGAKSLNTDVNLLEVFGRRVRISAPRRLGRVVCGAHA
jgi:hypothetical protein